MDSKEEKVQESRVRENDSQDNDNREPLGFAEHTRRNASERAHEQGWGLNEEERRKLPEQKQDHEGGSDYDYGTRDFGDTPVDTSAAKPAAGTVNELAPSGESTEKKPSGGAKIGERKPGQGKTGGKTGTQRASARRG